MNSPIDFSGITHILKVGHLLAYVDESESDFFGGVGETRGESLLYAELKLFFQNHLI